MDKVNYINNDHLLYHVILSKGKGYIDSELERMFLLLSKRVITKIQHRYNDTDMLYDCYMFGVLDLWAGWQNFNEKVYTNAVAYYTEIYKRGLVKGYNKMNKIKTGQLKKYSHHYNIKWLSMTNLDL